MDYPSDPAVRLHNNKFTDGDPVSDIPPSQDPAAHMNAVTDEILAVINAAGLAPDEGDLTQLLTAIQNGAGLSSDFGGSAGHCELPGGLILQWMNGTAEGDGVHANGFYNVWPLAFPNACLFREGHHTGGEPEVNVLSNLADQNGVYFESNQTGQVSIIIFGLGY